MLQLSRRCGSRTLNVSEWDNSVISEAIALFPQHSLMSKDNPCNSLPLHLCSRQGQSKEKKRLILCLALLEANNFLRNNINLTHSVKGDF